MKDQNKNTWLGYIEKTIYREYQEMLLPHQHMQPTPASFSERN